MAGSTSQTLTDIRALRTVASVSLPATFGQAKGRLIALRILLLAMLGPTHPLYRAFSSFVSKYVRRDDMWNHLLSRVAHGPAVLLRFVQLRLHVWFTHQETRDFLPPLPAPDFDFLFSQLEVDSLAWLPSLPGPYLAPAASASTVRPPARGLPIAPPSPAPGHSSEVAPATSPAASKPKPVAVHNAGHPGAFAPFQAALKTAQIRSLILKAGPPPSIHRGGAAIPMCATYHLRGHCFASCPRAADHLAHTPAEDTLLVTWASAGLPS
jgi:hypothetical protein